MGTNLFGQVLIDTNNPKTANKKEMAGNAILEIRGNGKQTLLLPRIANGRIITGSKAKEGMLAYRDDQKCFSFYNGTKWSECLEDVKTEKLSKITYKEPPLFYDSTTPKSFIVATGSNKLNILVPEAAVVVKVRSSHQITHRQSAKQCASQEIILVINGSVAESIKHTYPVGTRGRIFPVELVHITTLKKGVHTVDLKYRNHNPNCSTNGANKFANTTLTITVKEL